MTVVVVQCRLGSSRLPGKGLLDLLGKPVIARVLDVMKRVEADSYYLATDFDSFPQLSPVAAEYGWKCFAGSPDDVLSRFCHIAEESGADIIVRATGDNPFLFSDAASASVSRYKELSRTEEVDYFTYSGLPHGSGVEILNGRRLLLAAQNTSSPYDHEHVGPAFYNHSEKFKCIFEKAPDKWNFPEKRTTIDTPVDFKRAERVMCLLKKEGRENSYTSVDILDVLEKDFIKRPVLFVPSVEAGHGTGHLRRCLDLAKQLCADIFIPEEASLPSFSSIITQSGLSPYQIIRKLPSLSESDVITPYSLIVADYFQLPPSLAEKLWALAPVVALDEGAPNTDYCDYLLDIIPSSVLERKANLKDESFIPLPENRKKSHPAALRSALVCIGGEDPAGFTSMCSQACRSCGLDVREVTAENPVIGLREKLADFDLVVTHYGFTAFEACSAGCAVILVETSPLHRTLSESEGFVCIPAAALKDLSLLTNVFSQLISKKEILFRNDDAEAGAGQESLSDFIRQLSAGSRLPCPICGGSSVPDDVINRSKLKTYRICRNCSTMYLSWIFGKEEKYAESYFFDEYKNQYGKTYLEDFENIKAQGKRRISLINKLSSKPSGHRRILDVGCAFGPFLSAAYEAGWEAFGLDVSDAAVSYVNEKLGFKAEKAPFPDCNLKTIPSTYDALSMWFVIEHFKDLDSVLKKAAAMICEGGVFAFSTPSASGVSALFSRESFFFKSPKDHFTLLEMKKCKKILKKYGFTKFRCVSTGHHPERFPCHPKKDSLSWKSISLISRLFKLGDTFELYCVKDTYKK
ncbi:MAG: methyltransferase domain-containing protein [Treponemataceae bacterium]|nr:methyltransferase domain-containing protein [Treponemataceae bacterium]